jgi:hypothetical protein
VDLEVIPNKRHRFCFPQEQKSSILFYTESTGIDSKIKTEGTPISPTRAKLEVEVRVDCDLAVEIRRPNPLYVNLTGDRDVAQWDPGPNWPMGCGLMIACIRSRTGRAQDLWSSL